MSTTKKPRFTMRRAAKRRLSFTAAAAFTYTGSAALMRRLRHGRGDHRMYVLSYHDVCDDGAEREGAVSASRFRKHVAHLKKHFSIVSLTDAVALLGAHERLDRDYAVITLDDGYAGNYEHAFPILMNDRVPAAVFVSTGFLDGNPLWFELARPALARARRRGERLPHELVELLRRTFGSWPLGENVEDPAERLKRIATHERDELVEALLHACGTDEASLRPLRWDQVRAMARSGIEIGCHTVSHPILSMLDPETQRTEITRARDRIARETGRSPRFFAYPNGSAEDFTADTVRILKESGFHAACTTVRGPNVPGCDLFALRRIGVGADPVFLLEARLGGLFDDAARRRMGLQRPAVHEVAA